MYIHIYIETSLRMAKFSKQLSQLNPLSLSNNKNYILKKKGVFPL